MWANGLLRKILGYRTPGEAFDDEMDLIYAAVWPEWPPDFPLLVACGSLQKKIRKVLTRKMLNLLLQLMSKFFLIEFQAYKFYYKLKINFIIISIYLKAWSFKFLSLSTT